MCAACVWTQPSGSVEVASLVQVVDAAQEVTVIVPRTMGGSVEQTWEGGQIDTVI